MKRDVQKAIPDYAKAVELAPEHAGYRANLGLACDIAGDLDKALESYDEAIRLNPGQ